MTFSGDGRWLATSDGSIVRVWDVGRRTTAGSFVMGGGVDPSFSPDGTMLAVTGLNDWFAGGLEIRSVPALEVIRVVAVPAGTVARFAPDGRSLVYGDRDGRLWTLDARTWKPISRTLEGGAWIRDAAVSPDGRMLVTRTSHPAAPSAPRSRAEPESRSPLGSSAGVATSQSCTSGRDSRGISVRPHGRATPARSPDAR